MQDTLKYTVATNIYEKNRNKLKLLKLLIRNPGFGVKYGFKNILGKPRLSEIGKYHGTDKGHEDHSFMGSSYLDIYENYFLEHRDKDISVLEIGVKDGASLRTWRAYFGNAKIYGIDIDPRCKHFEEDRIRIDIGSQDDPEFLNNCFGPDVNFDIIIDDASHVNRLTIASFEHLFNKRLNSGGIYILEDLHCSYDKIQTDQDCLESWPGMKYNDPSKNYDNDRSEMDDFFADKLRKLDHAEGNIMCLHFWSMTCVVVKA